MDRYKEDQWLEWPVQRPAFSSLLIPCQSPGWPASQWPSFQPAGWWTAYQLHIPPSPTWIQPQSEQTGDPSPPPDCASNWNKTWLRGSLQTSTFRSSNYFLKFKKAAFDLWIFVGLSHIYFCRIPYLPHLSILTYFFFLILAKFPRWVLFSDCFIYPHHWSPCISSLLVLRFLAYLAISAILT